jgi:hypothetical protein
MTLEGYEALSHTQEYAGGKVVSLHFLLRSRPPNPPQAEELDLVYQPTIPMRDEKSAERMREMFTGLAETFAIIPTGQGLLAKFLAGEDAQQEANVLLISGVTLSVGSWLCSKILPARKMAGIKKWNARAAEANVAVRAHNSEVEALVQQKYAELIDDWARENEDRGVVKVTVH